MQTKLQINESLPVLAFNFEQLKAWATELAERYAGIVVTEDAIAEVKRDMAEINKAKKAVDEARKEAVRRVSEPIHAFEAQIREVCGIFDDAYGKLSTQVKVFENAQREEKRKLVEALIDEAVEAAYGEGPYPPMTIQESWLNKSTSLKAVREAVAAIIEKDLEEARRRKALEQAQQERAAAIETAVEAASARHGVKLAVSLFMVPGNLNLETRLADIQSAIDKCAADEAVRQKAASQPKEQPAANPSGQPVPQSAGPQSEELRAMSVIIQFQAANEPQVKSCLATLKTLCVGFGARYRQE